MLSEGLTFLFSPSVEVRRSSPVSPPTYSAVSLWQLVVLIGSSGFLEMLW